MNRTRVKEWNELPEFMQVDAVRPYWEVLNRKKGQLVVKRIFDIVVACGLLFLLFCPMVIIAIWIKVDSVGPVFFRQDRVTRYGKSFKIHKFRTMVNDSEKKGTSVTIEGDSRITKAGKILRRFRLDELPQLFDVIQGTMSFVGTRPEVNKYVERYCSEYYATLLMPAGITSEASVRYKNEDKLLHMADDVDNVYVNQIVPEKMKWNLEAIIKYSFIRDLVTMIRTVNVIFGKDYE